MTRIGHFAFAAFAALVACMSHDVGIAQTQQPPAPPQISSNAPPPLSGPRWQYYQDHPAEYHNLLQRFQTHTGPVTPGTVLPPGQPPAGGTWTSLNNPSSVFLGNPLLLTDGTVLAHVSCDPSWYKLTPDINGNYINGTWTQMASLPIINGVQYAPRFFGSGVLPDGRVIIEGGEYNGTGCGSRTTLGAIYDPVANFWMAVSPPVGWNVISDAAGIVLPNGAYMQTSCCNFPPTAALLNPTSLTWTATGTNKFDVYDEEAMAQTSNGKVLTVDAYVGTGTCGTGSEIYDPSTGAWTGAGNVPNQQSDCVNLGTNPAYLPSFEVGPLVMRPNGTAVTFSGLTTFNNVITQAGTAVYNVSNGAWSAGANIPLIGGVPYTLADAPGAVLPNGNILFAASPGNWTKNEQFPFPTHYFEMSIADNSITQVSDRNDAANNASFEQNLLVLPTGQVISFSIDIASSVQVYTPTGTYQSAWQPIVSAVPPTLGTGCPYKTSGTQFNGLSEGAYYGDDTDASSNFPLVRIVNNGTGHVFYGRTYYHSNRSIVPNVATSTSFQVATATESGASMLYVVANGIPSLGKAVTVKPACTSTHDANSDGKSDIVWRDTSGNVAMWLMNGATLSSGAGIGNVPPATWNIVGQRDFDGNGTADLLWRDSSGNTAIWFMSGTQVSSALGIGNIPTNWSVVGTGDFNGDGLGDILWQDTSGNLAVWLMNGATIMSAVGIGNVPPATTWTVAGIGDFDADGKSDILWRNNTSGDTSIWFMNGTQVLGALPVGNIPTIWHVAATGDFDADNTADILWRDTSGNMAVWLMSGSAVVQAAGIGNVATFSVVQTGDYNGDGKSDILWRDSSGNTVMWFMNGTAVSSTGTVGNIPIAWTVQAAGSE
jgi:hypothetical protein